MRQPGTLLAVIFAGALQGSAPATKEVPYFDDRTAVNYLCQPETKIVEKAIGKALGRDYLWRRAQFWKRTYINQLVNARLESIGCVRLKDGPEPLSLLQERSQAKECIDVLESNVHLLHRREYDSVQVLARSPRRLAANVTVLFLVHFSGTGMEVDEHGGSTVLEPPILLSVYIK